MNHVDPCNWSCDSSLLVAAGLVPVTLACSYNT